MQQLAKYISEDEQIPYKEVLDSLELETYDYYGLDVYSFEGREYAVGTDAECEIAEDEYLSNYIDDYILRELPENYQMYFDEDKWKRDAKLDGRGHALATYDGIEIELDDNLYAYRIN